MHPQSPSSNASEAIDKFSQDARLLFAELAELVNSMQSSSEADASSTAQHLALYLEAVTSLQASPDVVHGSAMAVHVC